MELQVWCQTDIGLRRERNEDSFLVDEDLQLFIVADGMGGHRGGEVASSLAVHTVREIIEKGLKGSRKVNPRILLNDAYRAASNRIFDKSHNESPELQGMGTTMVTTFMYQDVLYIANVGDSRAYLFSRNQLWQVTEDHSLLNEQIRAGLLNENQIPYFAAKNVITRSVGFEREVECDIIERKLEPGEMVLVCSDGLTGLVTDQRLTEICRNHQPSEIVSICVNEARKNGGDDNITVMLLCAKSQKATK
jgi:PPM family protein phosphatase